MATAFGVAGVIVALILAAAALCAAAGYLIECRAKSRWEQDRRLARETIRDLGKSLRMQAYWFSESDDALFALEALGEQLRDEGGLDISTARDRWRDRLREASQTKRAG